jgi:hypothetical protein
MLVALEFEDRRERPAQVNGSSGLIADSVSEYARLDGRFHCPDGE